LPQPADKRIILLLCKVSISKNNGASSGIHIAK
jgi:hypothetical protein